jgi:hypothetical protein
MVVGCAPSGVYGCVVIRHSSRRRSPNRWLVRLRFGASQRVLDLWWLSGLDEQLRRTYVFNTYMENPIGFERGG